MTIDASNATLHVTNFAGTKSQSIVLYRHSQATTKEGNSLEQKHKSLQSTVGVAEWQVALPKCFQSIEISKCLKHVTFNFGIQDGKLAVIEQCMQHL